MILGPEQNPTLSCITLQLSTHCTVREVKSIKLEL